jgi:hypothetical protein
MADHTKRFGKNMEFVDASGNDYAAAFAALSALSFDAGDEGGTAPQLRLVMRLWRDHAAYDRGKRPIPVSAEGTQKSYYFTGPELEAVLSETYQGVPVAKVITDIAWMIVRNAKDVTVEPPREDKPGVFSSFFEHAVDVQ